MSVERTIRLISGVNFTDNLASKTCTPQLTDYATITWFLLVISTGRFCCRFSRAFAKHTMSSRATSKSSTNRDFNFSIQRRQDLSFAIRVLLHIWNIFTTNIKKSYKCIIFNNYIKISLIIPINDSNWSEWLKMDLSLNRKMEITIYSITTSINFKYFF